MHVLARLSQSSALSASALRSRINVINGPTTTTAATATGTGTATIHRLSPTLVALSFMRRAHSASQSSVNGPKNGPGTRLGAKKSSEQYVIPGHIIFRQRGTKWFPGHNVGMGRDHTLYALEAGFVKFYRDPDLHPKRKYIGVVFERDHSLPYPRNAPRHRRLGMQPVPISAPVSTSPAPARVMDADAGAGADSHAAGPTTAYQQHYPQSRRRRHAYLPRLTNWEIGQAADKTKGNVRAYERGDRFLAWRKAAARRARSIERRGMFRRAVQGKGKKRKSS
ncbi:MAG: 54S ribosomal protein L2 mitochondrial [Phylliscum demangeonii]|nr:MAG: 54S ribosomal protein L2 mitochondrial [Phylliscum demangeonii]